MLTNLNARARQSRRGVRKSKFFLLGGMNENQEEIGVYVDAEALKTEPSFWKSAVSLVLDLTPVVGTIKSVAQVITGHDIITGEKVDRRLELIGM